MSKHITISIGYSALAVATVAMLVANLAFGCLIPWWLVFLPVALPFVVTLAALALCLVLVAGALALVVALVLAAMPIILVAGVVVVLVGVIAAIIG